MSQLGAGEPEARATFSLAGRNPDVLTCIANLSNDEVFTPPILANEMLDALERGWRDRHGTNIWTDSTVTFLDPFTKSGIFLREITKRLVAGLADDMPDLQDRVDHILTKQVYGLGITELTALLARRSLYCSKWANGDHSIASSFEDEDGNVWFDRVHHTWRDGRCAFCRASQGAFERGDELETHAYAFIHTDDINNRIGEIFGDEMKFDVIIGNPPYQIAADEVGQNVMPIYNLFVEQAKNLSPRYVSMVIPSRWMAGGKYLDDFRSTMLNDTRLSALVDYPNSAELFPGVDLKGGACYFLWDALHDGPCSSSMIRNGEVVGPVSRTLNEFDVFVRDHRAQEILQRVLDHNEDPLIDIVSTRDPFGPALRSNFTEYVTERKPGFPRLYMQGGDRNRWVDAGFVKRNEDLVDEWKVLMPKAGPGNSGGHVIPDMVLGRPVVAEPNSVCTLTYVVVGPLDTQVASESLASYLRTRFARFLVSLRKPSQDAARSVYAWVPQQEWDREWTDEALYEKYGISEEEAAYIESMIRLMEAADA